MQPTPMEQKSSSGFKQQPDPFTILIVEDNFLNRRMVKKSLEKNYIIKEADGVDTAEEILVSGKIHLVIIYSFGE